MKQSIWMTIALAAFPLALSGVAKAHDMHEGHDHSGHAMAMPAALAPEHVLVKLSNKPLSDQDGHSLRLKDDVVGDHIVVLSFVYTNCTTVCPVISSILADVQNKLGNRLDTDVRLVTVTVDPAHDTPSRLKSYSAQFDAKPGWFWLTGSSTNITETLKGFSAYTPNYENHPVVVMIGDGKTGKWSRHYGLSKSEHLLATVNEYLAAREKRLDAKVTASIP